MSQLKNHPELYDGYVPMGYADYLKKMSKYVLIFVFILSTLNLLLILCLLILYLTWIN